MAYDFPHCSEKCRNCTIKNNDSNIKNNIRDEYCYYNKINYLLMYLKNVIF